MSDFVGGLAVEMIFRHLQVFHAMDKDVLHHPWWKIWDKPDFLAVHLIAYKLAHETQNNCTIAVNLDKNLDAIAAKMVNYAASIEQNLFLKSEKQRGNPIKNADLVNCIHLVRVTREDLFNAIRDAQVNK